MTVTNYLCIGCPMGCHLEVEHKEEEIIEIRGSSCKRGKEFAQQEHTDPRRMVTTTVRVLGGLWPKLPVKTTEAIPKGKVVELCKELHRIHPTAPVKMGDIILKNALGTGIDVVASRDMPMSRPD